MKKLPPPLAVAVVLTTSLTGAFLGFVFSLPGWTTTPTLIGAVAGGLGGLASLFYEPERRT